MVSNTLQAFCLLALYNNVLNTVEKLSVFGKLVYKKIWASLPSVLTDVLETLDVIILYLIIHSFIKQLLTFVLVLYGFSMF